MKLDDFKKQTMALYFPEESTIIANKLSSMEEEYQQILLEIKYFESDDGLQNNNRHLGPKKIENNSISGKDLMIQQEEEKLKDLKAELNALLVSLKEDHPDVKILRKKIALEESKLENDHRQEVVIPSYDHGSDYDDHGSAEFEKLEARRDYLKSQIAKLSRRRMDFQKNKFTLDKLKIELENNQQTLNMLIAKLEDSRILEANEAGIGSIKILDHAIPPPHPLKKKKVILLAIGTILSILFGVGLAFISEYLDDSIKTIEDAEAYLNVTVIGSVPKITKKLRKS